MAISRNKPVAHGTAKATSATGINIEVGLDPIAELTGFDVDRLDTTDLLFCPSCMHVEPAPFDVGDACPHCTSDMIEFVDHNCQSYPSATGQTCLACGTPLSS